MRSIWCQLINASQMPESFTAIQVPPFGSRGIIARQLPNETMAGDKPRMRERFSSRFIATRKPRAVGTNETVHINPPPDRILRRENSYAIRARAS